MTAFRATIAVSAALVLLVATGCSGVEDPDQAKARHAVEAVVERSGGYPDERVHCTRTPRAWLIERKASVFLCTVQLGTGFCDLFRVRFVDNRQVVSVKTRKADCTLPI